MWVLERWLGDQEGLELGSLHPSLEAHSYLALHLQEELTPPLGLHRPLHSHAPTYPGHVFSFLPPSSPEMIGDTAVTMVTASEKKAAPRAGESATLFTTK